MIGIEIQSRLTRQSVVERAIRHFGPNGLDMEIDQKSGTHAHFSRGQGYVAIELETEPTTRRTCVSISGEEFDSQIREFIEKL
jgi:hypothetical protein